MAKCLGPQQLKLGHRRGWISQTLSFSKKAEYLKDSVQLSKEENTSVAKKAIYFQTQMQMCKMPPQISHNTSLFT